MPPQEAEKPPFQSSIGLKYPAHRDHPFRCADLWIEDKRADDGAEGLWRIHDDLYDLSDWIDKHPGGRDWIRLTKVIIYLYQLYNVLVSFLKTSTVLSKNKRKNRLMKPVIHVVSSSMTSL